MQQKSHLMKRQFKQTQMQVNSLLSITNAVGQ